MTLLVIRTHYSWIYNGAVFLNSDKEITYNNVKVISYQTITELSTWYLYYIVFIVPWRYRNVDVRQRDVGPSACWRYVCWGQPGRELGATTPRGYGYWGRPNGVRCTRHLWARPRPNSVVRRWWRSSPAWWRWLY